MLVLKNIKFSYEKNNINNLINNVSLDIGKGVVMGLAGPIGSGKSTLAKICAGLLKPRFGSLFFNGEEITDRNAEIIKGRIGLLFQYPEDQIFEETVFDDVAFAPRNLGLDEDEVQKVVIESMESVGLEKNVHLLSPFTLSGGELRKVAIAGVLAMNPELLIFDEPTSGLDPIGKRDVFNIINRLRDKSKSILMISHDYDEISELCDTVAFLKHGAFVFHGGPKDMLESQNIDILEIEKPIIYKLKEELYRKGLAAENTMAKVEDIAKILDEVSSGSNLKTMTMETVND